MIREKDEWHGYENENHLMALRSNHNGLFAWISTPTVIGGQAYGFCWRYLSVPEATLLYTNWCVVPSKRLGGRDDCW